MVFPESKRLHSIIERVVSADETTSTPSKIISSSINNLTVWYGKRDPISHRVHLFGRPSHCRTAHIIHQYDNANAPRRPYYFCWTAIPFAYDMRDQSAFSVRTESMLPLAFEQHALNPLPATSTALTLLSGDLRPAPILTWFSWRSTAKKNLCHRDPGGDVLGPTNLLDVFCRTINRITENSGR